LSYFFFYSPFKLCISTFDLWKFFVFVFEIYKCTYIDLHESEGLKDKLFSLFLCWTTKKNYESQSKGNKYILKKKDKKKERWSSTQAFIAILFVIYW